MTRKMIVALTAGLLLVVAAPASGSSHADPVVRALEGVARPLGRFVETVGDASVVGVGEATHGSHEFFVLQHRVFAQLVRGKEFGTFAREVSWSGGLRLDEYVVHGTGDPRQIMREEFQGSYLWNTEEYLDLIEWMRAYNERHPDPIRFMGDDIGYPGPELFDRVSAYAHQSRPGLVAELDRLHRSMAPTVGVADWMSTYPRRPLAERQDNRDRAWQAVSLLEDSGSDAWAVQHARVIAQSMTLWATDFTDPGQVTAGFVYRDEAMADNILWWREHTGDKIVLAGHDGHVADESYWSSYPRVQGTFLRERLGEGYLSVGTTFHHGAFNLLDVADGQVRTVTVGPAEPGGNESTLDRVRRRDFVLDMRNAARPARDWLAEARSTRQYAESFPAAEKQIALGRSFDVLVHFHRATPSRLLP
ncbi:erythromycin esterase family protein [Kibdelosporangium aridum]|uniref:Erythromycin esterase family protein n=1 Tax=Kibdelosporangium aridum TaxID=2030 RepID=A0A428Z0J6_KIBAR|nr:erythromycin esterase family protein [Kibdelosporangium aridum]